MEKGLISVDRWSDHSQVYFLTHLHSDHTQCLSSSWTKGPLFCSRLTAKLFPFKFPNFNLSLLRILEIGSWHSVSLVSPSSGSETTVDVMAIDAHHCPGAVMYLFRGDFGCMLFTGDFRWEATNERAKIGRTMLLHALQGDRVNILYLDNTYCNPSFSFPSREAAAQQVVDIIASHPKHDIIIGIDTLGKEDLLLYISRSLKVKIWVWPERLQTMHLLGFHDIFTTKTSLTRIRAVPRYSFSINTLEGLNTVRPTIGIMPSGLPWVVKPSEGNDNPVGSPSISHHCGNKRIINGGPRAEINKKGKSRSVVRFHQYIYSVPYSEHSCFPEIEDFIKLVQPINIKGIVSSSFCYIEPLYYFGGLRGVNPSSQRLPRKSERREKDENIEAKTKSNSGSSNFTDAENRKRKIDFLGSHLRRVSILRRAQRGVKIVENDSP
ncbi:5' exonuclease Apollo [Vitis vinifera]|uniref:Protein artemis n=1 Tax=Vitis vinifera TaxID=29760 RepID=A0A438GF57_VITVI|nr:5' exonuclease Apollo [Vitis vinifera]